MGGDLIYSLSPATFSDFNPRPRVGGDKRITHTCPILLLFQPTPPRGGRLPVNIPKLLAKGISTHAPAWGATRSKYPASAILFYFNPRPRVGGDPGKAGRTNITMSFQPTPPRGGRRSVKNHRQKPSYISTHAPAWGATTFHCFSPIHVLFQPTPPRGGRPTALSSLHLYRPFQPTPPRGGRHGCKKFVIKDFLISTHAPAWGATHPAKTTVPAQVISTHAPAWGATNDDSKHLRFNYISTHAPAWGATRCQTQ